MKTLTRYDIGLLMLVALMTGMVFGAFLGRYGVHKQAVQANAAHYELVNGGPATEFKWGPKP